MSGERLSVLIPTLRGREGVLFETTAAYRASAPGCEILTVEGLSWGAGLNELLPRSSGELVIYAADDAAPLAGWLEAASAFLESGRIPAARYLDRDGKGLVEQDDSPDGTACAWTRHFCLPRELAQRLGPLLDLTWWADIELSERIVDSGLRLEVCSGYAFTHLDGDRSWLTEQEEARQRELYEVRRAQKLGAIRA
jgi:hypothetical protein